jgi:hypothetical protein
MVKDLGIKVLDQQDSLTIGTERIKVEWKWGWGR